MRPASDTAFAATRTRGSALPVGTRIREYDLRRVVAEGRHGIVYLAFDRSLRRQVALAEYLPRAAAMRAVDSAAVVVATSQDLAVFRAGLTSFIDEARLLARFDHPSLVKVYRFWEENGTAYRVSPFCEGPTLASALAALGRPPSESELRAWLRPLVDALAVLHDAGVWHQDIAPARILMTPGGPVLLGPGAVRHAIAAATRAPATALHPGFAAIEQYGDAAETSRGPWTDFYALGAVLRLALTGRAPPPAVERLAGDTLEPLVRAAPRAARQGFLAAIDATLALQPERRPRDHAEFRALLGELEERVARPVRVPRADPMQQPFLDTQPFADEVTIPYRPLVAASAPDRAPEPPPVSKPMSLEEAAVAAAATHWPPSNPVPLGRASTAPGALPPSAGDATSPGDRERARDARRGKRGALVVGAIAIAGLAIAAVVIPFGGHAPGPTSGAESVPVRAGTPLAAPVATPAAPTPAMAASLPVVPAPPAASSMSAADRQARCVEILQRASLEGISAAETDFYKRECR